MAYTVIENHKPVASCIRSGKAIARAGDKAPILQRWQYDALREADKPAVAIIIEPNVPGLTGRRATDLVDRLARAMAAEMGCDPERSVTCYKSETLTDIEREQVRNQRSIASTTVADFWQTLRPAAARYLAAQKAYERITKL